MLDGTALNTVLSQVSWDQVRTWLASDGLRILFVLVAATVLRWLLHRAINRVVDATTSKVVTNSVAHAGRWAGSHPDTESARDRHISRARTMGSLLRSIATFTVFGVALLTVLALLGLPLGPLLASAGVGGVALGFGAQSLVKDFLSGVFMIAEDQYGVGDVIDTGEVIGTVEEVTLRITKVRDAGGVAWYVRNGEIIRIGNRTQGWSTAIIDLPVGYHADIEQAMTVLRTAAAAMDGDPDWSPKMIEPPVVAGVESVTGGAVVLRVTAKCRPQENINVQRELRERLKNALDAAGIPGPSLPEFGAGR